MKFERIRLHNFKCYGETDLNLSTGVTVIHGLNGSGKSSLLEASFFALYGSKALEKTLDEVVTIGADEMALLNSGSPTTEKTTIFTGRWLFATETLGPNRASWKGRAG